jgi:heat shock protein HtpX
MWELIRSNKRKCIVAAILLLIILLILIYATGFIIYIFYIFAYSTFNVNIGIDTFHSQYSIICLIVALLTWLIWTIIVSLYADDIILKVSKVVPAPKEFFPRLYNIVEEMKIAAGLSRMPNIYLMVDSAPNAFATGVRDNKMSIVVTTGLLEIMNRDELQGVIAHEMSHIYNKDSRFMVFVSTLVGSIFIVTDILIRYYLAQDSSSDNRRYSSEDEDGGDAIIGLVITLVIIPSFLFVISSRIIAYFSYFYMPKKREYLADAMAVQLTRYPEGLASALEKTSKTVENLVRVSPITAPIFFVNPIKRKNEKLSDISRTHPPISKRIEILRKMGGYADYKTYDLAHRQVTNKKKIIPVSTLGKSKKIPVIKPSVTEGLFTEGAKKYIYKYLYAFSEHKFITCSCGLKVIVPPDSKSITICPKCGNLLETSKAVMTTFVEKTQNKEVINTQQMEPLVYKRKSKGWETIECVCGHFLTLSPVFLGNNISCTSCGRIIKIEN